MAFINLDTSSVDTWTVLRGLLLCVGAAWVLALAFSRLMNNIRTKSLIRNLPKLPPGSLIGGNLHEVYDPLNMQWHHGVIKKYGGAVQIHGMLGDEQIYFTDPRAMHYIISKEFHNFEEPSAHLSNNELIMGEGMLSVSGEQHKKQRRVINPVFNIKHMRGLIPLFCIVSRKMTAAVENRLKRGPSEQEINILDWLSRTALELIGQAGVGYSFDSLAEGEKCAYTANIKDLMADVAALHVGMLTVRMLRKYIPAPILRWAAAHAPSKHIRSVHHIAGLMEATSREVLERRVRELAQMDEGVRKEMPPDILTVLLRANASASEEERLTESELIGQITTIIFAAQDTTSSALAHTLHVLCTHRDAQTKLREEIRSARATKFDDEPWSYDELNELPFLDAVCRETLRLHAPITFIWRTAQKPTTIPLLRPITGTDGQLITSIPIAANQGIVVGIGASNRDEAIFGSDANEWKPERWLNYSVHGDWRDIYEGKEDWGDSRTGDHVKGDKLPGVYSGMMTFNGGGRACIGFKFALLEMKVILAMLIEKFAFALPDKEIVWKVTNIQTPAVKGREHETPHLPLKLSLAA